MPAHNRRDGDDVIDFGRVLQSKHEPDAEDGYDAKGTNVFEHIRGTGSPTKLSQTRRVFTNEGGILYHTLGTVVPQVSSPQPPALVVSRAIKLQLTIAGLMYAPKILSFLN